MLSLPNIKITGLTGQSGAGKSTVRSVFEKSGFLVIDCDKKAKAAAENKNFLFEISSRFDGSLVLKNGSLDRAKTAAVIYSDKEKYEKYCSIIFPYIIFDIMRELESASGNVLLDAPTLFESGLDMVCGSIVCVTADINICKQRIMARDNISEEIASARLLSQHSEDFFREKCEYLITNNGSLSELETKTKEILKNITRGT